MKSKLLFAATIILTSPLFSYLLYPEYLSDDAFIHIGFINGLINGDGFTFAGNKTYGTTSPLWVLLGSCVSLITGSPELSIRILSGIFSIAVLILFYYFLLKISKSNLLTFSALISLAYNPFFLRWSLTGMESTAAVFFLLLLLMLLNHSKKISGQVAAGIVFGLSILLRPEFSGFFLATIFYYLFIKKEVKKLPLVIPAILIINIWFVFAYFHFGSIIPNTYIAKSSSHFISLNFNTISRDLQALLISNLPEFILLVIIIGGYFFIDRTKLKVLLKKFFQELKEYEILTGILWSFIFYIFYILRDVTIITRYALIFIPVIILMTITFVNKLYDLNNNYFRQVILLYLLTIISTTLIITSFSVKPSVDQFVNGFQKTYKEIAVVLDSLSNEKSISVGTADVGIIGAYSNARVFDSRGLVDNERFNYQSIKDYYSDKKPDYIIFRGEDLFETVIPDNASIEIIFSRKLPGFGIKDPEERTVELYKVKWQK